MNDQQPSSAQPPEEQVVHIPPSALVVLVGPAASGKSTFATRHFRPTQIVSSDACRAMIADDESDQEASRDAFRIFHRIINERLKRGLLTVADSTALSPGARADLLRMASLYGRPTVALVFTLPGEIQRQWNSQRRRHVPNAVLSEHRQMVQHAIQAICNEGFSQITIVHSPEEIDRLTIRVGAQATEQEHGPFDIIGDVHGCFEELCALLTRLGYTPVTGAWQHPAGRTAIFVGDIADRGPASIAVWQLLLGMINRGSALFVPGNHDNKLMRWLLGRPVRIGRGLAGTIGEFELLPPHEQYVLRDSILGALRTAPSYLLLDNGKLVVTHAGIRDDMIGHWDRQIASFCLYGDVAGFERDGTPIRRHWASERTANERSPLIVYGHVVVSEPAFVNETVDIDTGCCFGGMLTALRYPERTFVSVPALRAYAEHNEP